jgi:hypothetical protein
MEGIDGMAVFWYISIYHDKTMGETNGVSRVREVDPAQAKLEWGTHKSSRDTTEERKDGKLDD